MAVNLFRRGRGQAIKIQWLSVVRTSVPSSSQSVVRLDPRSAVSTGRVVGDGWRPPDRLSTPSSDRGSDPPSGGRRAYSKQVDIGQTTGQRRRERLVEWRHAVGDEMSQFHAFQTSACPSLRH